jgi:uracil-DNA glycosylase family 4
VGLYLRQLRARGVDRVYRVEGGPRRVAKSTGRDVGPTAERKSASPGTGGEEVSAPGSAPASPASPDSRAAPPPASRTAPTLSAASAEALQDSLFEEMRPAEGEGPTTRRILDARSMEDLERVASGCRRCGLCETRNTVVFGSGDPRADLVFVGEAPGRDEDEQGLPFVGRAGRLLTKIIESIGLTRDEVYIMNVLKCRPPGNRDPEEVERRMCRPYLEKQIAFIEPRIICALGAHAARTLLDLKSSSMKALREGVHYYGDTKVIPTYHPAALLRNPHWKGMVWEDMKRIRALLDEPED